MKKITPFLFAFILLSGLNASAQTVKTYTTYDCSQANAEKNDFVVRHLFFALEHTNATGTKFSFDNSTLDIAEFPPSPSLSMISMVEKNTVVTYPSRGVTIYGHEAHSKNWARFVILNEPNGQASGVISVEVDVADPAHPGNSLEANLVCLSYVQEK